MVRALTGLRGLAAAVVFLNHIGYLIGDTSIAPTWRAINPISLVGVFTFFTLSGYLLASPGSMRGGPVAFWRRRGARILPVYWVALITAVAVALLQGARPGLGKLTANLFLAQSWSSTGQAASINLPAWSLSVEMAFYALLPLALPAVARWINRQPRQSLLAVVTAAIAGSLALQLSIVPETFPIAYLPIFFLGIHAATTRRALFSPTGAWLAFVIGAVSYPVLHNYALPAIGAAVLIASLATTTGPVWLTHRRAVDFGAWSYAFFLIHVPALTATGIVLEHTIGHAAVTLPIGLAAATVAFIASWAVAALLYRWVEEPSRRFLTRPRTLVAAAPIAAGK